MTFLNSIFNRVKHRHLPGFCLPIFLLFFAGLAQATNYTFPGTLPTGCSGSNGSYSCSQSISLSYGDTIAIAGSTATTITINGDFTTASNNTINASHSASKLTLNITGKLTAAYATNLNANVSAGSVSSDSSVTFGGTLTSSGSISLGNADQVAGNVTAQLSITDGGAINYGGSITGNSSVSLGYADQITGNVTAGSLTDGGSVTYGGTITSNGSVSLGYADQATGNVSAGGSISDGGAVTYGGSITGNSSLSLGYGDKVAGNVSASSMTDSGSISYGGSISTNRSITLGQSDTVSGPITSSSGTINLGQSIVAKSCVTSTSSANINVSYADSIQGVCCGSSCNNSCVKLGSSATMPPLCAVGPPLTYPFTFSNSSISGSGYLTVDNAAVSSNPLEYVPSCGYLNISTSKYSNATYGNYAGIYTLETNSASPSLWYSSTGKFVVDNILYPSSNPVTTSSGGFLFGNGLGNSNNVEVNFWSGGASSSSNPKYTVYLYSSGSDNYVIQNTTTDFELGSPFTPITAPQISAAFSNASIAVNASSTLTITLTNPNSSSITGVAFTDTYPANLVNAAIANATTNCGGTVTAANGSASGSLVLSGATIPASSSCTVTVNVTSTTPGTYTISTGAIASSNADCGPSASATLIVSAAINGVLPGYFNCVEVGASPSTSNLYTKLSGTSFSLDVLALTSSGAMDTNYVSAGNTKTVKFELVQGPATTACANRSAISSQTLTYSNANQGRLTATIPATETAYTDVGCRITDANQASTIASCSTDDFAIRPYAFTISTPSSSAAADTSGSSYTASPIIKTSGSFALTATANPYNNAGVTDLGYTGQPLINNNSLTPHSGAKTTGTLSGNFSAASAGIATGSAFSYSEVGYFAFNADSVYDSSFTAIDSNNNKGDCIANSFSNALSGGQYGCNIGNTATTNYFGRFVPDHLSLSVAGNGTLAYACSNFAYNGQSISYSIAPSVTVSAYSNAASTLLTQNYTGNFMRLPSAIANYTLSSPFSFSYPTADATTLGVDKTNYVALTSTPKITSASLYDNCTNTTSPVCGTLLLTLGGDTFAYNRETNAMVNPFTSAIYITLNSATDSDNVKSSGSALTLKPLGEQIYYGRLNFGNANGSELAALSVPLTTQYYSNGSFITNTNDSCTSVSLSSQIYLSNASTASGVPQTGNTSMTVGAGTSQATLTTTTFSAGVNSLNFSAPGSGNAGYINIYGNIGGATGLSWLTYPWNQGNPKSSTAPSGAATFGVYPGNGKQIFFKEMY